IGGHLYAVRDAYSREVLAVLAARRDLFRLRRIAGPKHHVFPAVAREDGRERRTPGPSLEHGNRHDVPTRGSTPRTMRSMFDLCRMKTTVPATTMKRKVHQLKWSHPVAQKSSQPTSAPTTDATERTDTMRGNAPAPAQPAPAHPL